MSAKRTDQRPWAIHAEWDAEGCCEVHVHPLADAMHHDLDDECACGPRFEFHEHGVMIVHHSLDGRERSEVDA